MATSEASPSVYQGQPWTFWAERIGYVQNEDGGQAGTTRTRDKPEGDTMKLRKEDMALFGFCPARDDFYLVVCEICGQVVKPQALKSHIAHCSVRSARHSSMSHCLTELRHSGASAPKYEKMERHSKTMSSQDLPSTQLSPTKQQKGGSGPPPVPSPKHPAGSSSSTKLHSRHESRTKRNAGGGNHYLAPVVRVERMSPNMVMKKATTGNVGNNTMANAVMNSVPADKREMPSPQQPPPPLPPPPQPPLLSNKKAAATSATGDTKCKSGGSSSKSKVPKERKLLPCKDRVYDANKHCGVWVAEIGKQCTRSLTCKTHSLALRRAVPGRKKNFDELLADHRAAKEALVKATQASKESAQGCASGSASHVAGATSTRSGPSLKSGSSAVGSQKATSSVKSKAAAIKAGTLQSKSFQLCCTTLMGSKDPSYSVESAVGLTADLQDDKVVSSAKARATDSMYINHHPRPAAMCSFGARNMGVGYFVFDRRMDHVRTVLRTTLLERGVHPPPSKKLCVESKLPPVPDFSDPSDPYSFSWVDHPSHSLALASSASRLVACAGNALSPVIPVATLTTPAAPTAPTLGTAGVTKTPTAKPNKVKLLNNNKAHKDSSSINNSAVNRTSSGGGTSAKRKRTSAASRTSAAICPVSASVVVSESGMLTMATTQPNRTLHSLNAKPAIWSPIDVSRAPIRNNSSGLSTTLGTMAAIKNHTYTSANTTNAFQDLNIVVTSLDVANGQLPANTSAVLGRNLAGMHTLSTVTSAGGLSLPPGLNMASSTMAAAVQPHLDKIGAKKNRTSSNKGAKSMTTPNQDNRASLFSSYLPGIITSGVIVEGTGLHSAVSLPTVVNSGHISLAAVANSNMSPPTQPSPTTTPSPLFRSGSVSPHVPTLSPLPNGMGPSPPPPPLHPKMVNHLLSTTMHTPGMTIPSCLASELIPSRIQVKAKSSTPRHTSPKISSSTKCSPSHHLPAVPAQLSLSRTPTPRTNKSTMAVSGITFQQVYANQMLGSAPINPLHLPSKSGGHVLTGASPSLAMPTEIPLKILTTMPTVTTGSASPGQQHPSFLLQAEDLRHQEIQGSPSLHT